MNRSPKGVKTVLRTIAALGVLALIAGGTVVYSGIYNVAATSQHTDPVYYLLHYAMQRSVKLRAKGIQVPPLDDPRSEHRGLALYREHCLQCHGAPGVAPNPLGFGTRPAPANLVEAAREWPAAEIYWVVRHGLKFTAMPAWQYRLTDQELWDLTAFVKRLPTLSPLDYQAWIKAYPPVQAAASARAVASGGSVLGDAETGRHAIQQYLCGTCHRIPGVAGASATVGPPLERIATRRYLGGVLLNTPENMIRWLRDPQAVDPLSAMPDLHIRENDLRDIAAYLYTLSD